MSVPSISNQLRDFIKESTIKRGKLSGQTGIPCRKIAAFVAGNLTPGSRTIDKYCAALGLTLVKKVTNAD